MKVIFPRRKDVNFTRVLIDIDVLFSNGQVYFPNHFVYIQKTSLSPAFLPLI